MITELLRRVWPYIASAAAAVIVVARIFAAGKSAGINQERAKHADQDRENLDRIRRAADARPTGSVHDDPYNRDRL